MKARTEFGRDGCSVRATFGRRTEDGGPMYCSAHATMGMADMRKPRCRAERCALQPAFGFPNNGSRVEYCNQHRLEGMIDLARPTKHSAPKPRPIPKSPSITAIAGRKRGRYSSNGNGSGDGATLQPNGFGTWGSRGGRGKCGGRGGRVASAVHPHSCPGEASGDSQEQGEDSRCTSSAGGITESGVSERGAGSKTSATPTNGNNTDSVGNPGRSDGGPISSLRRGPGRSPGTNEQGRKGGESNSGGLSNRSIESPPLSDIQLAPDMGWQSEGRTVAPRSTTSIAAAAESPLTMRRTSGFVARPPVAADGGESTGGGLDVVAGVGGGSSLVSVTAPTAASAAAETPLRSTKKLSGEDDALDLSPPESMNEESVKIEQTDTNACSSTEATARDCRLCDHFDSSQCSVVASFGLPGGKRQFCWAHKQQGMVNLNRYSCTPDALDVSGSSAPASRGLPTQVRGCSRSHGSAGSSNTGSLLSKDRGSKGGTNIRLRRGGKSGEGRAGVRQSKLGDKDESVSSITRTAVGSRTLRAAWRSTGNRPANRSLALCRGEGDTCTMHASFGFVEGDAGKEFCSSHQLAGTVNLVWLAKTRGWVAGLKEADVNPNTQRSISLGRNLRGGSGDGADSGTGSGGGRLLEAFAQKRTGRNSTRCANAEGKPISRQDAERAVRVSMTKSALTSRWAHRGKELPPQRRGAAAAIAAQAGSRTGAGAGARASGVARGGSPSHKAVCGGEGCTLSSRFGYISDGKRTFCSAHKKSGMVNLDQTAKRKKKARTFARDSAVSLGEGNKPANAARKAKVSSPTTGKGKNTRKKLTCSPSGKGGKASILRRKAKLAARTADSVQIKSSLEPSDTQPLAPKPEPGAGKGTEIRVSGSRPKRAVKELAEVRKTARYTDKHPAEACDEASCMLRKSFGFMGGLRQFCQGHQRPGMVNLRLIVTLPALGTREGGRKCDSEKGAGAAVVSSGESTIPVQKKSRRADDVNTRNFPLAAKRTRGSRETTPAATSSGLPRSQVAGRSESSASGGNATLGAVKEEADGRGKVESSDRAVGKAVGRSRSTSNATGRVPCRGRSGSLNAGGRRLSDSAAVVSHHHARVSSAALGNGDVASDIAAVSAGQVAGKIGSGKRIVDESGVEDQRGTKKARGASGVEARSRGGKRADTCSGDGAGDRLQDRMQRLWQGARCIVCGRLAKLGCSASSCFECCVKSGKECDAHAKRLERKQREDELLAAPGSQGTGVGGEARGADDDARLPKGAFKEVSFHATGETATLWCLKDFVCGKETRGAMETLTRTQRADRLATSRGENDALPPDTRRRSVSRGGGASATDHATVNPNGQQNIAVVTNGCSAGLPAMRHSGVMARLVGANMLPRGVVRGEGVGGVNLPGIDVASLRATTVGSKWRRKHAELLSAVG